MKRPNVTDADRIFWILLKRIFAEWRDCLHLVKPETVLKWHRRGFRYYWARKSKPRRVGRPPIGWQLVHLIRRLSLDNVTWGAPRIRDELALLGHDLATSTIGRYMAKRRRRSGPDQQWKTFLANHMSVTAACDFFVVPTLTFRLLYVFVVLSHDRRRIEHVGVTRHPTAEWTAQQVLEAFPEETPTFLVHDRDSIYGDVFRQRMKTLGIIELVTPRRCPWRNGFCERVIGTIRRECTDHVIALGARHLSRTLRAYVAYYNRERTHTSLDGNAPEPRDAQAPHGDVIATPVLGGLHHAYRRAA